MLHYLIILVAMLVCSAAQAEDRYVISMRDGSVGLMQVVQGTAEEAVAKWPEAARGEVVAITKVDIADIPKDYTFRDAFTFDVTKKKFGFDLVKAKGIAKKKLSIAYVNDLKRFDQEREEADALGDDAKANSLAAKRSALKKVPVREIDAATTIEQLRGLLP